MFVNVFNFKNLFLGGSLPALIPDLQGLFKDIIVKNWLYHNVREYSVHIIEEEQMSPDHGAAGMFLELLFTLPELEHSRGTLIWQEIFGDELIKY